MKPSKRTYHRSGFTIVELLIVIVVIAILAAITIVAYNGIQDRARESAASQALSQAAKKISVWRVEQDSTQPPSSLAAAGVSDSGDVNYQYSPDIGGAYCITATIGNKSYKRMGNSSTVTPGACAGHGVGGVAPITNLAVNPAPTAYSSTQSQLGWRSDRYGSNGSYSIVTGASDGPLPGITSYARFTFSQSVGSSRGFHHVGNTEGACNNLGYPVTPGTTYTLSSYFRSSDGQGQALIKVRYCDSSNTWITGETTNSVSIPNGTTWVRPSVTTTVPVGAAVMHAQTQQIGSIPNHAIGDRIDGTGLMVTQGSNLYNYADGNSSNWIWNGPTSSNVTSTGPPL